MVTCIVLSAGLSNRFGSPKALAKIHKQTAIERVQKMLLESQVDEIIVVLGAYANQIKPHLLEHTSLRVVYNKDYNFGQTSSFQAGLRGASKESYGFMLLPVDFPFVRAQTVNQIMQHFKESSSSIVIPSYKGKKGHPPLFSRCLKDAFMDLDASVGLNAIAHQNHGQVSLMDTEDAGVVETFNTPQELDSLKPRS